VICIVIDGQRHEFPQACSILHALQSLGVDVPALCDDERLAPYGGCRLCIVEVEGRAKPVTACTTPISEGMRIKTTTSQLEALRRTLLELIAQRYPAEHLTAVAEKPLHRYLRAYELVARGSPDPHLRDESHPYLRTDMSACIDCYRCVRICADLQGQFVWQVWNRGDQSRIRPDSQTTLRASSCVSCGACADTCPTGAIVDVTRLVHGAPTSFTRSVCTYCGVGCNINVGVRDERIVQIKPVLDDAVSKGHLCVKGRYAFDYVHADDRATQPMIRRNGALEPVSWKEALDFTASELRRIVDSYGADSTGVLGSARATNEDNYLAQKFARLVLGTNNVDCCARVCHAPTAAAMKTMLFTGAATNSFDDIERARTILVAGSNATENHPIIGARIKQAALRGANLIVIDPRRIELAHYATIHLAPRPGTNIPLFNALAATIVREGLAEEAFLGARVGGVEEFRSFVDAWRPERAAEICGVDADAIVEAARLYARPKPAMMFHGLGVTEHAQGTDGVKALVNLALLTGNIGIEGAGVNPLRGQNNVQGSGHMGCDPGNLTGGAGIDDARDRFEAAWGTRLPGTRGLNLMQMMDAALAGRFKALVATGYDIVLTNPELDVTRRAFAALELVVAQDMFLTVTAREFATVFLPACSSFEKDGTFMNAERRIQRVRKTLEPLGESKPDWEIVCELARAMGHPEGFAYASPAQIWDEVRGVWPAAAGISYKRLDERGLQWPCTNEDDPGASLLHVRDFAGHERAQLQCIDFTPTHESAGHEYPYLLSTGRSLYQFNAGTMTGRTPNNELRPTDVLDVSVHDAQRLGLLDGAHVTVTSRYGAARLPVHVSAAMREGELFATFNDPQTLLNRLTGPERDGTTSTPNYKVTAVRITI
jgi:formate dehydrogenase major subunit